MKTVIVGTITLLIIVLVFNKVIKDLKKNKNLCGKDCCTCNSTCKK